MPTPAGVFHTTHWSVVLTAREGSGPQSEAALEQLCRTYSPALYAYLRRVGHRREDAQDLTQDFLSQFVQKEWLERLQDQRGRFRGFLLTFLKHFLEDERRRNGALKRGGGARWVSFEECESWESGALAAAELTPEQMFDRRWAQTVMARALEQLRTWYVKQGQLALFDQLRGIAAGRARTAQSRGDRRRVGVERGDAQHRGAAVPAALREPTAARGRANGAGPAGGAGGTTATGGGICAVGRKNHGGQIRERDCHRPVARKFSVIFAGPFPSSLWTGPSGTR